MSRFPIQTTGSIWSIFIWQIKASSCSIKSRLYIQLLHSRHLHWGCGHLSKPGTFELRSNSVWFVAFVFFPEMKLIPSERLFIQGLLSPPSLRCFCFSPLLTNFMVPLARATFILLNGSEIYWTANTSHQLSSLIKKKSRTGRIKPTSKLLMRLTSRCCCWSKGSYSIFLSIFIYLFSDTGQGFIYMTGYTKMWVLLGLFMKINCNSMK